MSHLVFCGDFQHFLFIHHGVYYTSELRYNEPTTDIATISLTALSMNKLNRICSIAIKGMLEIGESRPHSSVLLLLESNVIELPFTPHSSLIFNPDTCHGVMESGYSADEM